MKLDTLIERLQEARTLNGNLDVVVGEANGIWRSAIDVNVEEQVDVEHGEVTICIIQAYVVKK